MSNNTRQSIMTNIIHPIIVACLLSISGLIFFNSKSVIEFFATIENFGKNMEKAEKRRLKAEERRFKFEERTESHMAQIETSLAETAKSTHETSVFLSTEMKSLNFIVLGKVTQHMVRDETDKKEINKMLVDHSDRLSILEKGDK